MPFTGRQLYNKNISFDFGRCPSRAMFPLAFDLLGKEMPSAFILISTDFYVFPVKRQDVFGSAGQPESLIDRVVGMDEAPESYRAFEKGEVGKIIFDLWK